MPKLEYFLVSDSLSVDQETNNVSLFGICEEFTTTLPGQMPHVVATSSWLVDSTDRNEDFQATLRVRLDGESVSSKLDDFKINFTTERDRHRIFHHVNGLKLSKPGELEFEILLDGKHQATHTLTVHARDDNE